MAVRSTSARVSRMPMRAHIASWAVRMRSISSGWIQKESSLTFLRAGFGARSAMSRSYTDMSRHGKRFQVCPKRMQPNCVNEYAILRAAHGLDFHQLAAAADRAPLRCLGDEHRRDEHRRPDSMAPKQALVGHDALAARHDGDRPD